ncbi:aspartate kinase [Pararhodonellum marinum]|uniref:aspartate kinase n=1 Tax=Pararhodonellum marinum TaxID=2755358 RepID=UPI0018906486|nr:aspartate kinase [Pararhodonellum marinum]
MENYHVFKFGGASVKDADAIKNLSNIINKRLQNQMIIIISAIGKTTNALEEILNLKLQGLEYTTNMVALRQIHLDICGELFEKEAPVFAWIDNLFTQLSRQMEKNLAKENYDEFYDQVVGVGELLSTRIVQEYLCQQQLFCIWQDARELIRTNDDFRFAKVDWEITQANCKKLLLSNSSQFPIVTQGFIGREAKGRTTTLGREGSDFTAAILATCVKAKSVTIWKDVEGVLNADPKRFANTIRFEQLDYREAAELTYYGASVIHPKTIKPLANAQIPLFVKSFLNPEAPGTAIGNFDVQHATPVIVIKEKQILVTFRVMDFTFIEESHIHQVYRVLEKLKLKVNLLQISAITLSICIDHELFKLERLMQELRHFFEIRYNENLLLITVKNKEMNTIDGILKGREVLLEQATRTTFQVVTKA